MKDLSGSICSVNKSELLQILEARKKIELIQVILRERLLKTWEMCILPCVSAFAVHINTVISYL